jgi:hypothetical protein
MFSSAAFAIIIFGCLLGSFAGPVGMLGKFWNCTARSHSDGDLSFSDQRCEHCQFCSWWWRPLCARTSRCAATFCLDMLHSRSLTSYYLSDGETWKCFNRYSTYSYRGLEVFVITIMACSSFVYYGSLLKWSVYTQKLITLSKESHTTSRSN